MAMMINTNTASINAQRHLNTSRKELAIAMERLSSGQRINSAKDDAAGLAIRDKMTAQIEGLRQAVRNSNDAISLAQTAEGAMEEITNMLQRMRTLSVQAINDTNSSTDRQALNNEVVELKAEINRIFDTSTFNNINFLKDGYSGTFQIGHQAGETIDLTLNDASTTTLGTVSTATTIENYGTFTLESMGDGTYQADGVTIKDFGGTPWTGGPIIAADTYNGVKAVVFGIGGGSSPDNYHVWYTDDSWTKSNTGPGGASTVNLSTAEVVSAFGNIFTTVTATTIADISLLTSDNAASALTTLDQAIQYVSSQRSVLGAFQNRLSHATSNLSNMASNTESARSVIADADYAVESSRLAKAQILQQAGTAMLAQANSMAQSVLSLLK